MMGDHDAIVISDCDSSDLECVDFGPEKPKFTIGDGSSEEESDDQPETSEDVDAQVTFHKYYIPQAQKFPIS